jgi:hypothetical protein
MGSSVDLHYGGLAGWAAPCSSYTVSIRLAGNLMQCMNDDLEKQPHETQVLSIALPPPSCLPSPHSPPKGCCRIRIEDTSRSLSQFVQVYSERVRNSASAHHPGSEGVTPSVSEGGEYPADQRLVIHPNPNPNPNPSPPLVRRVLYICPHALYLNTRARALSLPHVATNHDSRTRPLLM